MIYGALPYRFGTHMQPAHSCRTMFFKGGQKRALEGEALVKSEKTADDPIAFAKELLFLCKLEWEERQKLQISYGAFVFCKNAKLESKQAPLNLIPETAPCAISPAANSFRGMVICLLKAIETALRW